MTGKDLWKGLGEIEDCLVEEASLLKSEEAKKKQRKYEEPKKKKIDFSVFAAVAAIFCLIVLGSVVIPYFGRQGSISEDTAATETDMELALEDSADDIAEETADDVTEDGAAADDEAADEAADFAAGDDAAGDDAAADDAATDDEVEDFAETDGAAADDAAADDAAEKDSSMTIGSTTVGIAGKKVVDGYYSAKDSYDEVYRILEQNKAEAESEEVEDSAAEADSSASHVSSGGQSREESDMIKTVGNYLYVADQSGVTISSLSKGMAEKKALISPEFDNPVADIREIFVTSEYLVIITEEVSEEHLLEWEEVIGENEARKLYQEDRRSIFRSEIPSYVTWMMGKELRETVLYVYEMKSAVHPVMKGKVRQDGGYQRVQKRGNYLYLFTEYTQGEVSDTDGGETEDGTLRQSTTVNGVPEQIPGVNGAPIDSHCMYYSKQSNGGIFMTSRSLTEPEKTIDAKFVAGNSIELYLSSRYIYCYEGSWSGKHWDTHILNLRYKNGRITAQHSAVIRGEIQVEHGAIDEYNGYLRILTMESDADDYYSRMRLYILGSSLKLVGRLEDFLVGKHVDTVKFLQDKVYLTFEEDEKDLYTIDLSNPKQPKLDGNVIACGYPSGFYSWGTNRVLGIGYEKDSYYGDWHGIRLTMFNISDSNRIYVENSYVIKGENLTCRSLNSGRERAFLLDHENHWIGLEASDWNDISSYYVFSYEAATGFSLELETRLKKLKNPEEVFKEEADCRGFQLGSYFYIVEPGYLKSYQIRNHKFSNARE